MAIYIICGFLAALFLVLSGMRGKEYNPNYFNIELLLLCVIAICGGMLSLIVVLTIGIWKSQIFGRALHKLANIEIKLLKDEDETNDYM